MNGMTFSMRNVRTEVVANDLCIGCGICAGLCPAGALAMEFNESGEYVARVDAERCLDRCDICMRTCPFADREQDESTIGRGLFGGAAGIRHTPETGYYLEAFAGYSTTDSHRENGASGGMATWVIETLLRKGMADYGVCVAPAEEPGRLFEFVRCDTAEEVRKCSRSCYYPVEMSGLIRHILSQDKKCAVIGLPCFVKGLRLAMQVRPELRERVKFLLGLTCGHTASRFFAEYVCATGGGDPGRLGRITFRITDPERPAWDQTAKFISVTAAGTLREGVVHFSDGIGCVWRDRYFIPNACNFCDDVFSELADAVFMDAWLPEYSRDPHGHSIVIVRDQRLMKLFADSETGSLEVAPLAVEKVIQSQRAALDSKRRDIAERLCLAGKYGRKVPKKREELFSRKLSRVKKMEVMARWLISQHSGKAWVENNRDMRRFTRAMAPLEARLSLVKWLYKVRGMLSAAVAQLRKLF